MRPNASKSVIHNFPITVWCILRFSVSFTKNRKQHRKLDTHLQEEFGLFLFAPLFFRLILDHVHHDGLECIARNTFEDLVIVAKKLETKSDGIDRRLLLLYCILHWYCSLVCCSVYFTDMNNCLLSLYRPVSSGETFSSWHIHVVRGVKVYFTHSGKVYLIP